MRRQGPLASIQYFALKNGTAIMSRLSPARGHIWEMTKVETRSRASHRDVAILSDDGDILAMQRGRCVAVAQVDACVAFLRVGSRKSMRVDRLRLRFIRPFKV